MKWQKKLRGGSVCSPEISCIQKYNYVWLQHVTTYLL
jgi:hypothetical protein